MLEKKQGTQPGVTLLGLGPGDPGLLTQEALAWLAGIDTLYLRTKFHPAVLSLPDHLNIVSFDVFYERYDALEDVFTAIVDEVLSLAELAEGVTYAVPGHPFIAEDTCPEIIKRAKDSGIPIRVIQGLSFLEPTFLALDIDPFPDLVLQDAIRLSAAHTPGFPPSSPALIAQIDSRAVAADVKLTLMAAYPDEHPVRLVHAAGTEEVVVEDLPLHDIDHSPRLGMFSSLYVPPLAPQTSFEAFQEIIARLRAPDGCPWDREQTHLSLRPFLLEETYETLDALDREDKADLQEELGDLLLQVVLHAQIATEEGDFNIHDVMNGIGTKLIRRHPHVFSEVEVEGVSGVIQNWEAIKATERGENGKITKNGILDGVPQMLPALSQSQGIIDRVGRVRFDYLQALGKPENILKLLKAYQDAQVAQKPTILGELLMAVAAMAYHAGIDAESALRESLTRFRLRFSQMELLAASENQKLVEMSADEKAALWHRSGEPKEQTGGSL